MIKRNVILFVLIVISVTALGQIGKSKFSNSGLSDICVLDDLKGYSFFFESVDTEADASSYMEYGGEYIDNFGKCGYLFIASPTGNYKMGTSTGMQEVKISKVIQGKKELENACVWIDGMPGLAYYEEDRLCIDALLNYMHKDNEYLIACEAYGPVMLEEQADCSKYYETNAVFGYLNITKRENTGGIVDIKTSYTFDELKEYEFFGTCQDVLDEKQKIKNEIIERYLTSIQ